MPYIRLNCLCLTFYILLLILSFSADGCEVLCTFFVFYLDI
nr:MAG TPA: Membrane MotB of proton-channel complex MotA/MotB [Bacteriophage sp.]